MIHRMNIKEFGQKFCDAAGKAQMAQTCGSVGSNLSCVLPNIIFHSINNLMDYHFDTAQIASYTSESYKDCFGGTINESYTAGLYDAIPNISLKKVIIGIV